MTLSGADLERLGALQRKVQQRAEQCRGIERAAGAGIVRMRSLWAGPDAAAFQQQWSGVHQPALRSAAQALSEAADTIGRNIAQQESTSAAVAEGSPGSPALVNLAQTNLAQTNLAQTNLAQGGSTDGPAPDEVAERIDELLSYGFFDWNVSRGEQQEAIELLLNSDNLPQVIAELDANGDLDLLIDRIDSPDLRLQLLRGLGDGLDDESKALVIPHVRKLGVEAEVQYHLGELGLPITSTDFNAEPYDDLISDDPGAPFTGVGATGVNPQDEGVGLIDSIRLGLGDEGTEDRYGNPLGPLGPYLDGLTPSERHRQVELLVNQPISSDPTDVVVDPYTGHAVFFPGIEDSYAGNVPSRNDIIQLAAERYDLEPELLTAVILAEQRDQSALEDAKDYEAAASILSGNTSIGLGQIVVSTAENNDLFSSLLSEETRSELSHAQIASLLSSDEVNIFATAQYIRQVADEGAALDPTAVQGSLTSYPGLDLEAYGGHSSQWPSDNIQALGSEYTSAPWDDRVFPAWGDFVYEAYQDTQGSKVFE